MQIFLLGFEEWRTNWDNEEVKSTKKFVANPEIKNKTKEIS
jgi:hypothetical protein